MNPAEASLNLVCSIISSMDFIVKWLEDASKAKEPDKINACNNMSIIFVFQITVEGTRYSYP
jgi:hypothetical protein